MTRLDQSTGRLSLRNSILVWVAGIVIGWGCAVVLFYQLIRDSTEEGRLGHAPLVAEAHDAVGVADIEPAAGPTTAGSDTTGPTATGSDTARQAGAVRPIEQSQQAADHTSTTQRQPEGS